LKSKRIIIADDSLTSLSACKIILKHIYDVYSASSAAKLFELLEWFIPDMLLLEVAMPDLNGYEIARLLKNNSKYKEIPIIFYTTICDAESELEVLNLGAIDFICKSIAAPLFLKRLDMHLSTIARQKELQELNDSIQKRLIEKIGQVMNLQNSVLQIVGDLVEFRDYTTGGHVLRIQKYLSCLINKIIEDDIYSAETMLWDMDYLVPSAQLHDVGKIAISDMILNKPAQLNEEEFNSIKTHAQIGVNAIERMEKTTKESSFFKYAKIFAGTHHEKWNGSGYPNGLKEDEIPLEGRLMAVVDVYDALVSARPYKNPCSHEEAVAIIEEGRGTHFDPALVDAFMKISQQFADIALSEEADATQLIQH